MTLCRGYGAIATIGDPDNYRPVITMSDQPNTMKIGMLVAFIGAIIAFVAMASTWDGSLDSAPYVGVDMAVAMIFFAVAGCFSTYSPVKGSTVLVLSGLTVAFSVIAAIYSAMEPIVAVILVILGVVCMVIANLPSTRDYVENARII